MQNSQLTIPKIMPDREKKHRDMGYLVFIVFYNYYKNISKNIVNNKKSKR